MKILAVLITLMFTLASPLLAEEIITASTRVVGTHVWPDRNNKEDNSKIIAKITETKDLSLNYFFVGKSSTQVHATILVAGKNPKEKLSFKLTGDGSANEIEIWAKSPSRWIFIGKSSLQQREAILLSFKLEEASDVLTYLRFTIVQKAGTSQGKVKLADVQFLGAANSAAKLKSILKNPPEKLSWLSKEKIPEFSVTRKCIGTKTVVYIDKEPLVAVLDVELNDKYLLPLRRAKVNCLVWGISWAAMEPRKGHVEWKRLNAHLQAYRKMGFAIIIIIDIKQPNWLLNKLDDEPRTAMHNCIYPNHPMVREEFTRYLKAFLEAIKGNKNLVGIGLTAGAEADLDFPEVPGDVVSWRRSSALQSDFAIFLHKKYKTINKLNGKWNSNYKNFTEAAIPVLPKGKHNQFWREFRPAVHAFSEFKDKFWLETLSWQGKIVRDVAPRLLILGRLSWPVFQNYNPFLVRSAKYIDLLQVKDAVAPWEKHSPRFIRSRAAIFAAAVRGTNIVSMPELDVGHRRVGATKEEIVSFLPEVAPFSGAIMYYRHPNSTQAEALGEALKIFRNKVITNNESEVGIYYGVRFANWLTQHEDYENENALYGIVNTLDEAKISFRIVSDYTLGDLKDIKVLFLPSAKYLSHETNCKLLEFQKNGGKIIAEKGVASFDLQNKKITADWKLNTNLLEENTFTAANSKLEQTAFPAKNLILQNLK